MSRASAATVEPLPRRRPVLRRRAEPEPAARAEASTQSLEALVLQHMPRIEKIARSIARRIPPHVPLDDLISAGTLGLIDAAHRFDPSVCERFESFAEPRIRGSMLDELRSHDTLSRELRSRWRKTDEVVGQLQQSLGRPPSDEEVAAEMEISLDDYDRLRSRVRRACVQSAEALSRNGVGAQSFADEDQPDPYQLVAARQMKEILTKALADLPERLQLVTSLYYKDGLTLSEIGELLGVTEARACQLRGEAVRRLRTTLDTWKVRDE